MQKLYLGPDLFYRDFRENIGGGLKSEETGWIPGIQGVYDFNVPQKFYGGVDVRWAKGQTLYDGSLTQPLGKTSSYQSHTDNTFFNIEGRSGYPFSVHCRKWSLTPFLGGGYQSWSRRSVNKVVGYDELYTWAYLAEGLRFSWNFSKSWQTGIHLKWMQPLNGKVEIHNLISKDITLNLGSELQIEVEALLAGTVGFSSIGFCFIPYFRFLPIGKSEEKTWEEKQIFEPSSVTIVAGFRLEFSYTLK